MRKTRLLDDDARAPGVTIKLIPKLGIPYALAHSKERHAFGKPIDSFQILQHHLADVAMEIELMPARIRGNPKETEAYLSTGALAC